MHIPQTAVLAAAAVWLLPALAAAQQPRPPAWRATEEIRIGSVDGGPAALSQIGGVVVMNDGRIFIAQPMDPSIRVFGADGRYERQLGRRGQGPGEFELLGGIGLHADTLYAFDHRLGRLTFFTADGAAVQTLRSPMADTAQRPRFLPSVPTLLFRDGTGMVQPGAPVAGIASGAITEIPAIRLSRDGVVLDTLARMPVPRMPISGTHEGQRWGGPDPFPQHSLLVPMTNGAGIWLVERTPGRAFRVIRIGIDGDTVFTRDIAVRPVPVSRAMLDFQAERIRTRVEASLRRRGIESAPSVAAIRQTIEAAGYVPPSLPPVTGTFGAVDGSLWLRREATTGPQAVWLVLNADGIPRATVELPRDAVVVWATASHVFTRETEELDVPYVVRYRLDR